MSDGEQTQAETMLKKSFVPLLILLLVVTITVVLFIYRDRVSEFEELGYLGTFLISLVANATIILPMPGLLLLIPLGAVFNPVLVALIGGAGGAIGELSGYFVGYSGRRIARNNKWFVRAKDWMRKWGAIAIFVFALAPFLPLDIAGIVAGAFHFPIWKFLLACFLGKTLLYIVMVLTGVWGWEALLRYFG